MLACNAPETESDLEADLLQDPAEQGPADLSQDPIESDLEPEEETPVILTPYFDKYYIFEVSPDPLFRYDGSVNQDVLDNLMTILDDPSLDPLLREPKTYWISGADFEHESYTAVTAADFSDFVIDEIAHNGQSGAIVIKLFETISDRSGIEHYHLTEMTDSWWQLVYRSTDDGADVLTLMMTQPYRLTNFSGTRYSHNTGRVDEIYIDRIGDDLWLRIPEGENTIYSDENIANNQEPGENYFFENNYSRSIARSNLLRDLEGLLQQFDIENYLVAPAHLPGEWQSSRYQTGTNSSERFYVSGEFRRYGEDYPGSFNPERGLGATGLVWTIRQHFSLINGKDGESIGPKSNHWPNTTLISTYYDLLWLPSDFEVRTMGLQQDNALYQTFVRYPGDPESDLTWNYREETPQEDWRYGIGAPDGRSGLWRLNGFDRGFYAGGLGLPIDWETEQVWLRSVDGLAIGNGNMVCNAGNRYGYGVINLAGMRPALHLSLDELLQN